MLASKPFRDPISALFGTTPQIQLALGPLLMVVSLDEIVDGEIYIGK